MVFPFSTSSSHSGSDNVVDLNLPGYHHTWSTTQGSQQLRTQTRKMTLSFWTAKNNASVATIPQVCKGWGIYPSLIQFQHHWSHHAWWSYLIIVQPKATIYLRVIHCQWPTRANIRPALCQAERCWWSCRPPKDKSLAPKGTLLWHQIPKFQILVDWSKFTNLKNFPYSNIAKVDV